MEKTELVFLHFCIIQFSNYSVIIIILDICVLLITLFFILTVKSFKMFLVSLKSNGIYEIMQFFARFIYFYMKRNSLL